MKTGIFKLIFIVILIFTSCNPDLDSITRNNKNFVEADASTSDKSTSLEGLATITNETSKFKEIENIDVISFLDNTVADIYDTMVFESKGTNYDNNVINTYLRKRGFDPNKFDGEIKKGDLILGQYHLDSLNERMSFVLRVWNYDIEPKPVFIACITFDLKEIKERGFIEYDFNEDEILIGEVLYSEDGKVVADIEYEHNSHFPFSIIKAYKTYNENLNHVTEVLNRNEKFWFYKERMNQTNDGLQIDYVGDVFYINQKEGFEANKDRLTFNYKKDSQLDNITGSLVNDDLDKENKTYDSMMIDINYSTSGLDYIEYSSPPLIYGSYDSIGEILYDDYGRMIYNSYYVTHGSIERFYFYKENEQNPHICLMFDSMPIRGEDLDGISYMYGNYSEVYMFDDFDE